MKLRQIVCDKTDLHLGKEKEIKVYGEVFTIEDDARAIQILNTTYKGMPVAEVVEEDKEEKKTTNKRTNKNK